MEQKPQRSRFRVWIGRLLWLAGGAFLVLVGFWALSPCVTDRVELVNLETVPADAELFFMRGRTERKEELLWRGRLDGFHARELAFDLGQVSGRYRIQGRHAGANNDWNHEFGYVMPYNFGRLSDIVLIRATDLALAERDGWKMCAPGDLRCKIPELAVLAMRGSQCLVKGRNAWWR